MLKLESKEKFSKTEKCKAKTIKASKNNYKKNCQKHKGKKSSFESKHQMKMIKLVFFVKLYIRTKSCVD